MPINASVPHKQILISNFGDKFRISNFARNKNFLIFLALIGCLYKSLINFYRVILSFRHLLVDNENNIFEIGESCFIRLI